MVDVSSRFADRAEEFRHLRLTRIHQNDTPLLLKNVPKIVLHVIPYSLVDRTVSFSASSFPRDAWRLSLYGHQNEGRIPIEGFYNFDGYVSGIQYGDEPFALTYTQVFRNGAIEAVEALLLRPMEDGTLKIYARELEEMIIHSVRRLIGYQQEIGVDPPFFVALSLLGVRNYHIPHQSLATQIGIEGRAIDRNDLVLPEVFIESTEFHPESTMRGTFDAIWNAAGYPRSMNYSAEGLWNKQ